jgi:outer membrane protein OmpA-like peptidoglycan-associated protein
MNRYAIKPLALVVAAVLTGCSSMPDRNSMLEQARADYGNAQANPQVVQLAAGELRQAGDSLDKANTASNKGEKAATVDHLAYVAKQHVAIAQETARQKNAELMVAHSGAERDRVRLEARTREADAAQRDAEYSQRQAEASQRNAQASQRDARASQRQSEASQRDAQASQRQSEASQRQAEVSQRSSEAAQLQSEASQREATAERQAAADAQLSAQSARQATLDAEGRTRHLEALLAEMAATKTERGMVITLGDVLFDTNQSQLRTGGMRNVEKLAAFVKQYPRRNLMIEGFTDSVGSGGSNQQLSDDRAGSVRSALLGMGVGSERMTSRGYGESYPVASNDTHAGRQQNRRVEIVVSEDGGTIAPR